MDFNSIKVRLKLHNLCRLQVQKHEFQFHKGTIKTRHRSCSQETLTYFNSIKVRLKRYRKRYQGAYFPHFNSIKVRLKHFYHNAYIKSRNFNSIKVRLKREEGWESESKGIFQFHKGTIKTTYTLGLNSKCSLFQFHKGTIKTRHACFGVIGARRFQFHKGTIKTGKSALSLRLFHISIP